MSRISFFVQCTLSLLIIIGGCTKYTNSNQPAPDGEIAAVVSPEAYIVHGTIRRLEALNNGQYNYEINAWVTANADSLTALVLPGQLRITAKLSTGTNTVYTTVILDEGSVITRSVLPLTAPVSVIGKFAVPGTYQGKPVFCNATILERPYDLPKIHVQGTGFADEAGNAFIPWGFNYTNTDQLPLVDYDWYNDSVWEIIKQDIREMKALDINIIRIHLQYNRFMVDAYTPNAQALARLKELVDFAGIYGLYVDITGLGCYFKMDTPVWYDAMNETERWATQAVFWSSIAQAVGNCNNVFDYNLMNEPVVPSKKTDDWLPGDGFAGYNFVQNLTRTPAGRSGDIVTRQWISTLNPAIRAYDGKTMITVGFIGLGIIARFNDLLDYNSAHIYPETGKIPAAIQFVEDNQTDKPLIIEETGPLAAGFDDMELFINSTKDITAGYLSHYQGQTVKELRGIHTLPAIIQWQWYDLFTKDLNPNYYHPVY